MYFRREIAALLLLFTVAGALLFSNLGAKYLWQDEAATAVLADRLMKFGTPLAYDGVNLITMDNFSGEDEGASKQLYGDPAIAVQHYADHGDYRRDTTWIGQPWGQFMVAGTSLRLFGHTTTAARLPFAAIAFLTIGVLYGFVRTQFRDAVLGWTTAAILSSNVFWVIHSRQCRYYALSSLFVLLMVIAFIRWQQGRSWSKSLFVFTALCAFHVDYGSFFPTIGTLLLVATWAAWPRLRQVLFVGLAIGATIAPWVWYYRLINRMGPSAAAWPDKFLLNLFHLNQFLIPVLLLLLAGVLLATRWRRMDRMPRQILFISVALLLASLLWVPTVAPFAFYRYIVQLTPLASLCSAWVLCQVTTLILRRDSRGVLWYLILGLLGVSLVACPVLSNLLPGQFDRLIRRRAFPDLILRPEWAVLYREVFTPAPDPNRLTVEALSRLASSHEEVLINYEDIPLMFYTDYRIRGGIASFRVEDSARKPPRFLIYRQSASFVDASAYIREVGRYRWRRIPLDIPDVPWGNFPEPEFLLSSDTSAYPSLVFAENLDAGPSSEGQRPQIPGATGKEQQLQRQDF
ncbi:MAG: glycosyltransferase family 39 protein [Lentisphaerae bacterium]|nr:glycosyltransferase family 39 protein [Lentisphaerota bacterium]